MSPESDLREAVMTATPRLRAIPEELASVRSAPGKWSAKEVLGHLIDSASNNHQRFVRAQFADDLVCAGYDQDAWVAAQHYQEAAWSELVSLWASLNLHLARVIEGSPAEARSRPRAKHNLDKVAFRPVPAEQPTTLEYFMADYVAHLKHHLAQILATP